MKSPGSCPCVAHTQQRVAGERMSEMESWVGPHWAQPCPRPGTQNSPGPALLLGLHSFSNEEKEMGVGGRNGGRAGGIPCQKDAHNPLVLPAKESRLTRGPEPDLEHTGARSWGGSQHWTSGPSTPAVVRRKELSLSGARTLGTPHGSSFHICKMVTVSALQSCFKKEAV